jgi:mannose-6-phosphate isomerase-like protein (cupin superfamily)
MSATPFPTRLTPQQAAALPLPAGRRSALVGSSADFECRHYAPRGSDPQTPHDRDELYVVISGSGHFVRGSSRVPFAPGDLLFVAAHEIHRFEDFSEDFACWVMFFGPVQAPA